MPFLLSFCYENPFLSYFQKILEKREMPHTIRLKTLSLLQSRSEEIHRKYHLRAALEYIQTPGKKTEYCGYRKTNVVIAVS